MDYQTQKYPLDFDALQKGDVITPEQITEIFGIEPSDRSNYQWSLRSLARTIERQMQRRGRPVTVDIRGYSIHVLTDKEAIRANEDEYQAGWRRMKRRYKKMLEVDVSNLSVEDKKVHARCVEIMSKQTQAAEKVEQRYVAEGTKRRSPGLPRALAATSETVSEPARQSLEKVSQCF